MADTRNRHVAARGRTTGALAALLLALAGVLPLPALPAAATPAVPSGAGVLPLTVAEARAEVDRVTAEKQAAEQRLVDAEARREQIRAQAAALAVEQQDLVQQLETSRRKMNALAVGAYIAGGAANETSYLFAAEEAGDLAWRQEMLQIHGQSTEEAADEYQRLAEEAEGSLVDLAEEGEENLRDIDQARSDIELGTLAIRIAEARLAQAQAEALAAARGPVGNDKWARLRQCESGGNYQTNTGNGFYGAYQFDLQTWQSVGGSGLPSDAPPEEQDARARALYARRGAQPWPVCGRFLL